MRPADLLAMCEANPDGGGISRWDGKRLRVFKNTDGLKVVGFILSHWDRLKYAPCLIHFRLATHNGIAWDFEDGPYESDTKNMVTAWIDSGYDNRVFQGQGYVALITPHGCLKWIEGDPVLLRQGVMVSNMHWMG